MSDVKIVKGALQDIEFNEKFAHAYDLLENSKDNLFITGKAGTGKSTLLRYFREHTTKRIVVLAPTGVAAVNIKGQTIHSFFRFRPDVTVEAVASIRIRKKQQQLYQQIDCLVIDEVSMVRADLMDCMDRFLRIYGKHPDRAFGGVQVAFFGDLYQLPPVVTNDDRVVFANVYKSPFFFDAQCFRELNVEMVHLQKIYRQQEEDFIRLLSTIRNNSATKNDIEYLNKRLMPQFQSPHGELYIYLTSTNALADEINRTQLELLSAPLLLSEGDLTGEFDLKSLPTQISLPLKEGAQVMLLNNDPSGRWINGTIGKITFIPEGLGLDPIEVELEDGSVQEVMPFTWEMFRFSYNEELKAVESDCVGTFRQYPLRLAWALTIHKSQGKTFTKVVVDIGRGTFSHGQVYVALSRCTNYNGLVLKRPIHKRHVLLDSRIVEFMNDYQKNQSLEVGAI